jgi:glyoxylase-like metal-dependent hydrolase (beta-lactamase superfamily II)
MTDGPIWRATGSVRAAVSLYLVDHGGVLSLIDTGVHGSVSRILRMIDRAGRKPEDVRQIILTHCHGDHAGSAKRLKELTGATVVAGSDDVAVLEGRGVYPAPKDPLSRALYGSMERFPRLEVDRAVAGREELDGGLVAIPAPGHTMGHMAVHAPGSSTLFVGDAVWNLGSLRPTWRRFTADVEQSRESVRALASVGADRIVISHGPGVSGRRLRDLAARL